MRPTASAWVSICVQQQWRNATAPSQAAVDSIQSAPRSPSPIKLAQSNEGHHIMSYILAPPASGHQPHMRQQPACRCCLDRTLLCCAEELGVLETARNLMATINASKPQRVVQRRIPTVSDQQQQHTLCAADHISRQRSERSRAHTLDCLRSSCLIVFCMTRSSLHSWTVPQHTQASTSHHHRPFCLSRASSKATAPSHSNVHTIPSRKCWCVCQPSPFLFVARHSKATAPSPNRCAAPSA